MSEGTDARVILNLGRMITLANGEQRRIQLDNEVAMGIEDRYGSITGFGRKLQEGAIFHALTFVFALIFKVTEKEALALIDAKRLTEYGDALAEAVKDFMGQPGEVPSQEERNESPGDASTPSPSSTVTSAPGAF